ncbi:hypothetical protein [Streptomyces sp. CMB-StM0423]|uniref:hypothetical protein n=1 Tax=Streptomyces sp. CMB-StM0423 TaxID=2059884 RepID=UPI001F211FCA|nr:hypothetical protein [Streptomyces sp. CMB-StM0423]
MPLGLAGPGPAVAQVEAQLDAAAPGAFEVKRYADEAGARTALREQDVLGAIVVGPSPKQPPGLLVASAAGDAPTTAATTAYEQLTVQLGTPQKVDDVAPLPEKDSRGVSAVLLCVALTIGALIFQLVLSLAAAHVGAPRRWLSCLCYAVVAGAAGALFAGPVTGTLDGHFLELLGVATLLSLTVVGVVAACQALLGALGIAVGALLVLPLGLASSGGVVDPHFQPAFYGAVSEYLPMGSTVSLLRRVLYFDGNAAAGPLLTLALWAAGAWLVTVAMERIRPFRPLMVIVPAAAVAPSRTAAARTA